MPAYFTFFVYSHEYIVHCVLFTACYSLSSEQVDSSTAGIKFCLHVGSKQNDMLAVVTKIWIFSII